MRSSKKPALYQDFFLTHADFVLQKCISNHETRAVFGFGGSRVWQFLGMAVVVVIHIMVLSKTVLNVNVCVSKVM